MITRSTIQHVRLPFSYVLLPVYLLALISVANIEPVRALGVFLVLHFLLYPAANGFNSFYDRDQGSIGMLARPPTVTSDLLWVSLVLKALAILAGLAISGWFAFGCLVYALGSMAYSYPGIRLKRYPYIGWLCTGLGQGGLVFVLVALSVQQSAPNAQDTAGFVLPALALSALTLGFYPLTQVYQHKEDADRGFWTISLRLGMRGTFYLSSVFTLAGMMLYAAFLVAHARVANVWMLLIMNVPAAVYFVYWFSAVVRDETEACFRHATRLSILAASGMNLFALWVLIQDRGGWQVCFGV